MPRNYYIVNKNNRPAQGGGPPGDFGVSKGGAITPTSDLTKTVGGGPPTPQFISKSGMVRPTGLWTNKGVSSGGGYPGAYSVGDFETGNLSQYQTIQACQPGAVTV